jgi:hypothetical protein
LRDGVALGDLEAHQQRLAPHHGGERASRRDVLPGLHRARLHDSGQGRPHEGVLEVQLGLLQRGPGLGGLGGSHAGASAEGRDLLGGEEPGLALAPRQAGFGVAA